MKKIILFILLLNAILSRAQNNFSGTISDVISGETIPSAVLVWGEKKDKGAVADVNGKFNVQLPKGRQIINFSAVGYEETMLS